MAKSILDTMLRMTLAAARNAQREAAKMQRNQLRENKRTQRAQAAAEREVAKMQRAQLRVNNRAHKEAQKAAIEAEKDNYDARIHARELLRMSFLEKTKKG